MIAELSNQSLCTNISHDDRSGRPIFPSLQTADHNNYGLGLVPTWQEEELCVGETQGTLFSQGQRNTLI